MIKTFGARLRQLREVRGLSQRDLAAQIRVSVTYLDKLERDYHAPPSAPVLRDAARALKADADELFALSGKIPPELENALTASPLLVQLAKLGAAWEPEQLREFLRSQGVPEKKLGFEAARNARQKSLDRRVQREHITAETRRAIFALDGWECVYCSSRSILEIDHIFPHSHGGTDEPGNLVTCCAKCNGLKKAKVCTFPMVFGRFRAQLEGGTE